MATFVRTPSGVIYLHHFIDGRRFKVSTHIKVDESKWTTKNGGKAVTNLVMYKNASVNASLKKCLEYLNEAVEELTEVGGGLPKLKELYEAERLGKRTIKAAGNLFMPYFKAEYERLQDRNSSTWKHYRTTYRVLEEYLTGKNPSFDQIDMIFYDDFSVWMEQTKDYKVSNSGSHWKRIKTVMRLAEDQGLHKNQQYKRFKRSTYSTDNIALSPEEIDRLAWAVLPERLISIRDHFLLACYTGARLSDWGRLTSSAISSGIWKYKANKTKETCRVKISDKAKAILNKYNGVLPECTKSSQTANPLIREACREAGINGMYTTQIVKGGKLISTTSERWKLVTSHTGRRTFATRLILLGVPVHLVMTQTGHKSLSSFEAYIKLKELQADQALASLELTV